MKSTKKTDGSVKKNYSDYVKFLQTFVCAFLLFLAVCLPAAAILGKVANRPISGDDSPVLAEEMPALVKSDSPFFKAFNEKGRMNVLILGINTGLTDTIMLASFDQKNKHVDVISIPRDTYYHREGYNSKEEDKINAAYKKDPINTAKAVSDVLLGMPINYYMVLDYQGVAEIVNAMGGVPMDIPQKMDYEDPYDKPPLKIHLPKGYKVLNGEEAVQFLRYRSGYVEGDLGRVKAQQEFIKSAFKQCLSKDLPKIAKTVVDNVKTDISPRVATSLALSAAGIQAEDITTYMLPGTPMDKAPWYVIPDAKGIAKMLEEIYHIEPVSEAEAEKEEKS